MNRPGGRMPQTRTAAPLREWESDWTLYRPDEPDREGTAWAAAWAPAEPAVGLAERFEEVGFTDDTGAEVALTAAETDAIERAAVEAMREAA